VPVRRLVLNEVISRSLATFPPSNRFGQETLNGEANAWTRTPLQNRVGCRASEGDDLLIHSVPSRQLDFRRDGRSSWSWTRGDVDRSHPSCPSPPSRGLLIAAKSQDASPQKYLFRVYTRTESHRFKAVIHRCTGCVLSDEPRPLHLRGFVTSSNVLHPVGDVYSLAYGLVLFVRCPSGSYKGPLVLNQILLPL